MAKKTTYGARGNASRRKQQAAKKKEEELDKVLKKSSGLNSKKGKGRKTQDLLDALPNPEALDNEEIKIFEIPGDLQDRPEDAVLYDNEYIRQFLEVADKEREEYDEQTYKDLIAARNPSEVVFTDWDVKIDDEIEYFDPELSYELTGYRPITETKGLDFDPDWFREPAITKEATGKYTTYEVGGPYYANYWVEQNRRCIEGYTYNGYTVTGDNYFYLNFYRMSSPIKLKSDQKLKVTVRNDSFPTFIAEQYKYFHYVEMCRRLGLNVFALKSRGIGWSEMGACFGVNLYTNKRQQQAMYTASAEAYLTKTLEKCWRQLDFLNLETEGGFKHLRQAINQAMQKKASKKDSEGNESGFGSMITGIVADNANKVRGDRTELIVFEEAGSDKFLIKKWIQADALIIVGGNRIGMKIAYGTGRK